MESDKRTRYATRRRIHLHTAELNYFLDVFGDVLAEREGWRDIDGLEAVRWYLVCKHHWLPAQVNAMSMDDLRFAMREEMQGWTVPPEAQP